MPVTPDWLFQIPFAYFLAIGNGMGPQGVFVGIAVAETAIAVTGIIVFRRGKWKEQKI